MSEENIETLLPSSLRVTLERMTPQDFPIVKNLNEIMANNPEQRNIWQNPFEMFDNERWHSPQVYANGQVVQQLPEYRPLLYREGEDRIRSKKGAKNMGVHAPRRITEGGEKIFEEPARVVAIAEDTAKVFFLSEKAARRGGVSEQASGEVGDSSMWSGLTC